MTSSDNVRAQAVRLHPLLGFCLVFIICCISCIDDISRQSVSQSHNVEGSSLKCIVGFTREKMYLASDLVELNLVNSIKHRSKAVHLLQYVQCIYNI